MNLREFDLHLDNYKKVMGIKDLTLKTFYKQFEMCFLKTNPNFYKTYWQFKANSVHLKNTQLNLGV